MKKNGSVKKLAAAALLTAAALIVYMIEAQLPPLTPIPGIKLGLSNVFSLMALMMLGPGWAFAVMAVRVMLGSVLTGQVSAIIFSLAGGVPSIAACILLKKCFRQDTVWALSCISAIIHNSGQMAAAIFVTGTREILFYYPLLIISGIVTGAFTGLCAQSVIRRMKKN